VARDGRVAFGSEPQRHRPDLDRGLVLDLQRRGVGRGEIGKPWGRPVRLADVQAAVDPRQPDQDVPPPARPMADETELHDLMG
jgi:hypothetical protein